MDKIMHGVGEQKAGVAPLPTTSMDLPQIALPLFANHRLMPGQRTHKGGALVRLERDASCCPACGVVGGTRPAGTWAAEPDAASAQCKRANDLVYNLT
jgi:hypothetical protein